MNLQNSSQNMPPTNFDDALPVTEKPSPKVTIYADGSCLKNGSEFAQAGAGIVLVSEDRRRIKLKACFLGALTNQKAEILACAVALESLKMPSPRADLLRFKIRRRNDAWEKSDEDQPRILESSNEGVSDALHRMELDARTQRQSVSGNRRPAFPRRRAR